MKFGLVLSGGGARAAAHLGIIQALEEEGVNFCAVSGASAGALIGAFYCSGYRPKEILEIFKTTNYYASLRPSFSWKSLLNIERASMELMKHLKDDTFESLDIPLYVTTTDIERGKSKVYKKGKLLKPVLASCCIPVVFNPIVIGKRTLVDGGILDNLPYKPIKKTCDKIIALHCNPMDKQYQLGNWKDLLERSMMLTMTSYIHTKKRYCDVFIEPAGLSTYKVFEFKKIEEIYYYGYHYAREQLAKGLLNGLDTHKKNQPDK